MGVWCSWLSHALSMREVPGSIPVSSNFFFSILTEKRSWFCFSHMQELAHPQYFLLPFPNHTTLIPPTYSPRVIHVPSLLSDISRIGTPYVGDARPELKCSAKLFTHLLLRSLGYITTPIS
jgi:hypothetical protein